MTDARSFGFENDGGQQQFAATAAAPPVRIINTYKFR